ncbi:MAG: hypothetical protein R3C24_05590 [Cyanobacteriota/Melainabacteria group bacterium]
MSRSQIKISAQKTGPGLWLVLQKPGAKRTFLISHGNAGNLSHRYLIFMVLFEADGSVFIYDYRLLWQSCGQPNDRNIVEDSVAAYDFMVKELAASKPGFNRSLRSNPWARQSPQPLCKAVLSRLCFCSPHL